jgi:hypothetical protein
MRLLGQILLISLFIAALQGILAVLAVGIVLALILGLIVRPTETAGLLLFLLLLKALEVHPWATIGIGGLLVAAVLIARRKRDGSVRASDKPRLLSHQPVSDD